jgi:tetratricopeptide (TPR) repeat protein
MFSILLIYVAWKKIKAVPSYYTINISLIFWSVLFILSIVISQIGNYLNLWIICVLLLAKLGFTIFQKREILQWKKRVFKRGVNFFSVFLENSSKTLQKALRTFVWGISILIIVCFCIGIPYLGYVEKLRNSTNNTINELFNRVNHIASLSTNDNIYFARQQAAHLQKNFQNLPFLWGAKKYEDWATEMHYYQYALCQYSLGRPEDFLKGIKDGLEYNILQKEPHKTIMAAFFIPLQPQTTIKAAFELGMLDDCRKLINEYQKLLEKNSSLDIDKDVIWTALQVGLFDEASPNPSKGGESQDDGDLLIYQAHALLMTGEREKALPLYRQQINNRKNEIEKDFAVFRWLGFSDTEISIIEKELNLNKIAVYTRPTDDTNTVLAQPFIGKWQYEENEHRINLEIKDSYNLCHYLFQTKTGDKEWSDEDIAVTRYRLKQMDNRTIIEEYNVRRNELSVREISLVNDDELQIKEMENGEVMVYRRVK